MTSILDLPNELLVHAISYLEYDRGTLLGLPLACRSFAHLTPEFVFRHIEDNVETWDDVSVDKKAHSPDRKRRLIRDDMEKCYDVSIEKQAIDKLAQSLDRKHRLLQRSFSSNPKLREYVRSCGVWGMEAIAYCARNSVFVSKEDLELLECLPNVTELYVHFHGSLDHSEPRTGRELFGSPKLRQITTLTITGPPYITMMEAYMKLPCLNRLRIISFEPPNSSPPRAGPFRIPRYAVSLPIIKLFSGTEALQTVRKTLKTLQITGPCHAHLGTCTSLHNLHRLDMLTDLRISGHFIFPKDRPAKERIITNLLPSSLETLHIECSPRASILDGFLVKRSTSPPGDFTVAFDHYSWIFQFPRAKSTNLPKLRHLRLTDRAPPLDYKLVSWKPPQDLADEFEGAEVEFTIQVGLRIRMGYPVPLIPV